MSIDAGSIVASIKFDFKDLESGLKQSQGLVDNFSNNMSSTVDNMNTLGNKMSLAITAPLVIAGKKMISAGADFESGMSNVQAIAQVSSSEIKLLEDAALEMGRTTKFSATEASEALQYMAMAGWDTNQMLDALPGVMDLAAASGEELGLVSDIVTDALTAFGMKASEAGEFADLLASASSNSNTNVAMMGETFKYVAPVAGALGYTAEDTALAIGLMANAGIKSSQAGTSLRSIMTRLVKPTKEAQKSMDELGITVTNSDGTMKSFQEVLVDLRGAFSNLDEEQKAQHASSIAGQQAMSGLLAIVGASEEDFGKLVGATVDYNGAAKEMAEIMEDNLQGEITKLKSALEGVAIDGFKLVLPLLTSFVESLQNAVDWVANLSDTQKELILKFLGVAAAAGPVLKITSSLGGLFTELAGKTINATTATSGFSGSVGILNSLLSPTGLAIAGVTAAVIGVTTYLSKDAIPAVDLYGDEVSSATKKAVDGWLGLESEAMATLERLKINGTEISYKTADSMEKIYEDMASQITTELDKYSEDSNKILTDMYEDSKTLTKGEMLAIQEITDKSLKEQKDRVEKIKTKITDIYQKAADENRKLTEDETEEIARLTEEMKIRAIKTLSEGELEHKAIMQRMKDNASELSLEQALEVIKNSKEQKEKTIEEAEKEYTERIKLAEQLKAEGTKEASDAAEKIIKEAKKQRDGVVEEAEKMHEEVISEAKKQAEGHVDEIDWETGEVLSRWQVFKNRASERFSEIQESADKHFKETNKAISENTTEAKNKGEGNFSGLASSADTNFQSVNSSVQYGIDAITEWNNKKAENKEATFTQRVKRVFETIGEKFDIGNNNLGTSGFSGGWTWVGEQGRELVKLPKGTQIKSNSASERMSGNNDNKIENNFEIKSLVVREEADVRKIANELYSLQKRNNRGGLQTV